MKRALIGFWSVLGLLLINWTVAAETVQYHVAASVDDTGCTSSTNAYNNYYMLFPSTSDAYRSFVRWEVDIPDGAVIESAYLKIRAWSASSTDTTIRLELMDYDNCDAFYPSNPYARSMTGTSVDWAMPNPYAGSTWYTSPDIKTLVQAFIDRAGYSPGNYLGLRCQWLSGTSKNVAQYDSDSANGAILEVTYSTNQVPLADAGSDQNVTDTDESGYETVTLDGTGSSDSDGTITSYVWKEGETQIATGVTADVSLSVGTHTITLTVTDNDAATDDDAVVVTVNSLTTAQYQVAASVDDTGCTSSTNAYNNYYMLFPSTSDAYRSFVRWAVDIPDGAVIESAYLKIRAWSASSTDTTVRLELMDYDNCDAFYPNNPYARSMTGTSVDWAMPNPYTGSTWYTSPDIKTLVQAFIDREGYSWGNYLGLRCQWLSGTSKNVAQYDSAPANGAILEVTYSYGGGNQPPVAAAGSDQNVTDTDESGYETVTLDGTGSSDSDGTITSYVWKEGETQIATGATADVSLSVGTHTITLTVTDDDAATDDDTVVVTVDPPGVADYYIDFDGGSDGNSGTSAGSPWKHCPGDPNATGNVATCTLSPGDVVVFKGGVTYRGSINCNWSGSDGLPIVYDGNTAGTFGTGQAVVDGSETLSGWTQCQSAEEALGNPNWANIWYAYAPAGTDANTSNLYQYDGNEHMCWMAQAPNQPDPFFMDDIEGFYTIPWANVTKTSVTDSVHLDQADANYWNGAGVMVWVKPNLVVARDITGFNPATDTITFATTVGDPYTDRDEKYALYNHVSLLDQAGEYYFNDTAEGDGTHKVYLWPPAGNPNANPVSISVPASRTKAFSISSARSYITFDGLKMQKFSGPGYYDACGIVGVVAGTSHIVITDCVFMYMRHDYRAYNGYGAVVLNGSDHTISGNTFFELPVTNGMQLSISDSVIENNLIERPGRHGMWMTFTDCQILDNIVLDVNGSHANGIAVFPGSSNVLVMGNTVICDVMGIAVSDTDDVTVAYNVLCCETEAYSDQGSSTNLKAHNNTMLNTTNASAYRNLSNGELKNNIINIPVPNESTLELQLVDSDSCPALSTNPWSWAVTGPTVAWGVPNITLDTWYTSPDISAIVQAYVNRPGYDPGDYFGLRALWVSGSSKTVYAWDYGAHTDGPKLVVTYNGGDETCQTAASVDDTFATSSSTSYTNGTQYWPYGSSTVRNFVRWAINIPKGATITSATVQVKAKATTTGGGEEPSLTPDANGNLKISHAMESAVFADRDSGDFHLKAGSPAVDAGEDLGYEHDIEGTAVPQGDDPDIGAYEYAP